MGTVFLNVVVQWTAIAILIFLLIYASLQKPSEMQKHVIILTIASIFFLSGYLVRIDSNNIPTAMLGATITYIGQPFVLLSAMMLISTFYDYHVPKWLFVVLVLAAISVPLIVYSNPHHHLFYAITVFDPDSKHSPLLTTHGPLYNANLVMAGGYFVSYVVLIHRGYKKMQSPVKRTLAIYTILMLLSGMVGYILYFLKLTDGYDTTMLGVSIGAVFLSVLFFRCRIFDIADKAKDYALEVSTEGLAVFNDADGIVYKNPAAEQLLNSDLPGEFIRSLPEGKTVCDRSPRHYAVTVQMITNGKRHLGKSVEMHDISESVNHRARLEEAVRDATEHLETVQRTIFGSMASIVEARSLETGDHIKRVSGYAEMIAHSLRDMGKHTELLTDEYISSLVLSAPLHDIGKISIPDAILLKPGRLTPEEFDVIKSHAAKGAEIIETTMKGLEDDDYITMAADGAHYHHEWWDGSGYPCGLKGEEIPLCARIVALADCYDAMTSKRCYKEAFPDEQALDIIRKESGTHFDPTVVDAFLRCDKAHVRQ